MTEYIPRCIRRRFPRIEEYRCYPLSERINISLNKPFHIRFNIKEDDGRWRFIKMNLDNLYYIWEGITVTDNGETWTLTQNADNSLIIRCFDNVDKQLERKSFHITAEEKQTLCNWLQDFQFWSKRFEQMHN